MVSLTVSLMVSLFHRLRGSLRLPQCLVLSLAFCAAPALADWPQDRPIQLIVPFPAGSSPDVLARTIAEPLAARLGQAVVVDNRPGAGGNIGTRQATQAKPDGYTLLLTINGPVATAPALYKNTLGYEPATDLAPVTLVGVSPNVLAVPQNSPAQSLQDFVAMAKAQPGALNYGTVGPGSSSHLAMAMLEAQAGISLLQIPYNSFPQVATALMSGDLHAGFMVPATAMVQVSAGKLRVLAVTSLQETDLLPGIPSVAEQGYPGFESISWDAVFVPAGTPAPVVERLNRELTQILAQDEVRQKLATLYFTPAPSSPQGLADLVKAERTKLEAIIQRLGLSLD